MNLEKSCLFFICKISCQKASRKAYYLFFVEITSEAKLHEIYTVSKTVSGLHETMFRIRNFFSLYFDSVKMMEFILLYEANIPLKKPTCI